VYERSSRKNGVEAEAREKQNELVVCAIHIGKEWGSKWTGREHYCLLGQGSIFSVWSFEDSLGFTHATIFL